VFLSHTGELSRYPTQGSFVAAAKRAVERAGHAVVEMDSWTAADLPPAALDIEKLAACDVYVGVVGFRYGSPVREDPSRSYTEHEFDTAGGLGLPRLVFLLADDLEVLVPREVTHEADHELSDLQEAFRARVDRCGLARAVVRSPKDLETALYQALTELRDRYGSEHSRTASEEAGSSAGLLGPVFAVPPARSGDVPRPHLSRRLHQLGRFGGRHPYWLTVLALVGFALVMALVSFQTQSLTPTLPSTSPAVASIDIGTPLWGVAFSPDGDRAYVTNTDSASVSVIDTTTNAIVGNPIPVGDGPWGVVLSPDGRRAYVTNLASGSLSVIDTATNVTVSNPIPVGRGPEGLALSPNGRYAYVANSGSGTVSVIDVTRSVETATIPVGRVPAGVAVSPDGRRLYVANNGSGTVSVIDTATNATVGNPIPVGSGPYGVAVTPDGRRAYVANSKSGSVSVIDADGNSPVGTPILVGTNPTGVVASPDGRRVYVANNGSGTVSVIDTATNATVGNPIPVGSDPAWVAVSPEGRRIYVTHWVIHGTVSVIRW
jgi:YVTN family beta-propeller protein